MIEWLRGEALEPEITIAGRSLPIEIRRHPRARRLTLRLAPDGSAVRITLPRWCASKEAIEAAALASEDFLSHAAGAAAKKVIVVPGRLVNVVI